MDEESFVLKVYVMSPAMPPQVLKEANLNLKEHGFAERFRYSCSRDDLVQTVWDGIHAFFKRNYDQEKYLGAVFSRLVDSEGLDISCKEPVGKQFSSQDNREIYMIMRSVDRECSLPVGSDLQPQGLRKRRLEDLSPAEQERFKRRRRQEEQYGAPVDELDADIPVTSRESAEEGAQDVGMIQHEEQEVVRMDNDGFKIPPPKRKIAKARKPRTEQSQDASQATVLVQNSQPQDAVRSRPSAAAQLTLRTRQPSERARSETMAHSSPTEQAAARANVVGPEPEITPDSMRRRLSNQTRSSNTDPIDSSSQPENQSSSQKKRQKISTRTATPNNEKRWTATEDRHLLRGFRRKWDALTIKRKYKIERTESAIRNRKSQLQSKFPGWKVPRTSDRFEENSAGAQDTAPPPTQRVQWSWEHVDILKTAIANGFDFQEIQKAHFPTRSEESVKKKGAEILDSVIRSERRKDDFPSFKTELNGWTDSHAFKLRRAFREGLSEGQALDKWFGGFTLDEICKKMAAYRDRMENIVMVQDPSSPSHQLSQEMDPENADATSNVNGEEIQAVPSSQPPPGSDEAMSSSQRAPDSGQEISSSQTDLRTDQVISSPQTVPAAEHPISTSQTAPEPEQHADESTSDANAQEKGRTQRGKLPKIGGPGQKFVLKQQRLGWVTDRESQASRPQESRPQTRAGAPQPSRQPNVQPQSQARSTSRTTTPRFGPPNNVNGPARRPVIQRTVLPQIQAQAQASPIVTQPIDWLTPLGPPNAQGKCPCGRPARPHMMHMNWLKSDEQLRKEAKDRAREDGHDDVESMFHIVKVQALWWVANDAKEHEECARFYKQEKRLIYELNERLGRPQPPMRKSTRAPTRQVARVDGPVETADEEVDDNESYPGLADHDRFEEGQAEDEEEEEPEFFPPEEYPHGLERGRPMEEVPHEEEEDLYNVTPDFRPVDRVNHLADVEEELELPTTPSAGPTGNATAPTDEELQDLAQSDGYVDVDMYDSDCEFTGSAVKPARGGSPDCEPSEPSQHRAATGETQLQNDNGVGTIADDSEERQIDDRAAMPPPPVQVSTHVGPTGASIANRRARKQRNRANRRGRNSETGTESVTESIRESVVDHNPFRNFVPSFPPPPPVRQPQQPQRVRLPFPSSDIDSESDSSSDA